MTQTAQDIDLPTAGLEARPGGAHYGVFDRGAQVFAWRPAGARPVIWMSERARFAPGAAIRGGVPVCFPWFGAGPSGAMTPAHGFARLIAWRRVRVEDTSGRDGRLVVDYALDDALSGAQPAFPHRFLATLRAEFARDYVQIDLVVKNRGAAPFVCEAALHSYLAVGDARRIRIEGLDGARYLDKAVGAGSALRMQAGPIAIEAETDRIYHSSGETRVVDPVWERSLVVTKGGSAQTVVWNPWIDKARAMPDFGDDEWTGMVCVEAAALGEDAIRLSPGGDHCLWQRIALA